MFIHEEIYLSNELLLLWLHMEWSLKFSLLLSFFHSYAWLRRAPWNRIQNFSLQQFGVNSGRASIASCTSLPPTQVFTTIGIYKGERVAIKKVAKKKVSKMFIYFFPSSFSLASLLCLSVYLWDKHIFFYIAV